MSFNGDSFNAFSLDFSGILEVPAKFLLIYRVTKSSAFSTEPVKKRPRAQPLTLVGGGNALRRVASALSTTRHETALLRAGVRSAVPQTRSEGVFANRAMLDKPWLYFVALYACMQERSPVEISVSIEQQRGMGEFIGSWRYAAADDRLCVIGIEGCYRTDRRDANECNDERVDE